MSIRKVEDEETLVRNSSRNRIERIAGFIIVGIGVIGAYPVFLANPILGISTLLGFFAVGLCFVFWNSIKRSTRKMLRPFKRSNRNLQVFLQRGQATPDMLSEMKTHRDIVFIGLSQSSLHFYIMNRIEDSDTLPWETINILYCNNKVGYSWEGESFLINLKISRQKVAALLTDRERILKFPNLKEISFHQYIHPLMYGGSIFGGDTTQHNVHTSYDCIYVVQYLPTNSPDTKKALTWKISFDESESDSAESKVMFNKYLDAYEVTLNGSKSLGKFTPSVWDISTSEWKTFCENYLAMRSSVNRLIELSELKGTERVIDLAAGTGFASKMILEHLSKGHLTILDKSPQMLTTSQRALGDVPLVDYALCGLPIFDGEDIDIQESEFDVIFCHLSISTIAMDRFDLETFSNWCYRRLAKGGRVVINAHNGILDLPRPNGYATWDDPFRNKLKELIGLYGYKVKENNWGLSGDDVESAFNKAGFEIKKHIDQWPITMLDRYRLWMVPAIFDTLIEGGVKQFGIKKAKEIVSEAYRTTNRKETMPRSIVSWHFSRQET